VTEGQLCGHARPFSNRGGPGRKAEIAQLQQRKWGGRNVAPDIIPNGRARDKFNVILVYLYVVTERVTCEPKSLFANP
jgi:hypothetical protein